VRANCNREAVVQYTWPGKLMVSFPAFRIYRSDKLREDRQNYVFSKLFVTFNTKRVPFLLHLLLGIPP